MNDNKIVLHAAIEDTYGARQELPDPSYGFLVSKPSFEVVGKQLARKAVLPTYGTLPPINIGEALKISFETDILCSGAAGTAPQIGTLLRACNLTETVTPATKVEYTPHSDQDGESLTIYFQKDGQLFALTGCVGTVKGTCKSNEFPTLSFEFTGIYTAGFEADSALVAPTFATQTGPFPFRGASFSFMGWAAPVFESFDFDLGNEIAKQPNANAASGIERYFIKGRSVKGSCDPEVVALSTFDPWDKWHDSATGALTATIGTGAGSTCIISSPNIALDTPKHGEREGITTYALGWSAHPTLTAGNNEIKFTFQ